MSMTPAPISADIGSNQAPIKDRLELAHETLLDRIAELVGSGARSPEKVTDDATLGKVGDLYKLMQAAQKAAEGIRVAEKEPYLMGGREVDNFFQARLKPLTEWMDTLKRRSSVYLNFKAEQERKKRLEEARLAQEEANRRLEAARKAEEANRKKAAETKLATAVAAQQVADQAAERAEAKPAEMVQTRGDHSLATVAMQWTFAVDAWDDVDLNELAAFIGREAIEKGIRAYVRIHKDQRPLKGVRIYQEPVTQFR